MLEVELRINLGEREVKVAIQAPPLARESKAIDGKVFVSGANITREQVAEALAKALEELSRNLAT